MAMRRFRDKFMLPLEEPRSTGIAPVHEHELSQMTDSASKASDEKEGIDSKFAGETSVNVYDVEGGERDSREDEVASIVVKDAADIGAVIVRLVKRS
jgi:hypothetical protein